MSILAGRRRVAWAAVLLVLSWSPGAASAAADVGDGARAFVESLADQAIHALTVPDISRTERISRFRVLFTEHFAVQAIAKWVLGRHWRRATPDQQTEYVKLFEDLIVASYVERFAEYTGETLSVTKTIAENESSAIVFSKIVLPDTGKTPIRVDWRVDGTDGGHKIVDLVVEGVSMSTTLRSDFGSIIRREGGRVAGLLHVMREKTRSLRQSE